METQWVVVIDFFFFIFFFVPLVCCPAEWKGSGGSTAGAFSLLGSSPTFPPRSWLLCRRAALVSGSIHNIHPWSLLPGCVAVPVPGAAFEPGGKFEAGGRGRDGAKKRADHNSGQSPISASLASHLHPATIHLTQPAAFLLPCCSSLTRHVLLMNASVPVSTPLSTTCSSDVI